MTLFQNLLTGLLSGIAEVLCVSPQAHRLLLLKIFGLRSESPALRLMVHIAAAFALYLVSHRQIVRMLRAQRLARVPKKRRKRPLDTEALNDLRLLKTTLIPTILMALLYSRFSGLAELPLVVAALTAVSGIVLYIPQYLPGSNLDSGALTPVDALLMGLGGAAGMLPGISGLGCALSLGTIRGMEPKKALTLALLINIPVNLGLAVFDFIALLSGGAGSISLGALFGAVLAGIAAFAGVILGIRLLNKIIQSVGSCVFGFYSFGFALLTFILFLAAV